MERYFSIIVSSFLTIVFGCSLWILTEIDVLGIAFWCMSFYLISAFSFQSYLEYLETKRNKKKTIVKKPDSILMITLDQNKW